MKIGGFEDVSTIDWYGKISTTIFFSGCNFRCGFCYNSGILEEDSGTETTCDTIIERIESNKKLIDSVVFTGGEPSIYPNEIEFLSQTFQDMGLSVMFNTNGTNPKLIEKLCEHESIDRLAMDVKTDLGPYAYSLVNGRSTQWNDKMVKNIIKSMDMKNKYGVELELRTTIVPTLVDGPNLIERLAPYIIDSNPDVWYLQQFQPSKMVLDPIIARIVSPNRDHMYWMGQVAKNHGIKNVWIKTLENGFEEVKDCP